MIVMLLTMSVAQHVVVWKTTDTLPPQARHHLDSWNPMPLVIVNDTECGMLARRHHCTGYDRTDIMNIMRADACRYMALYEYGGIYSDLDVTLKRPFDIECSGLCVGKENNELNLISNYCFMAPRFNPCLLGAIHDCCRNLVTVKMDFKADPHLVHNSCGPTAFTASVLRCAHHVWSYRKFEAHLHHAFASGTWRDYPSWAEERRIAAGWSSIYEH
jgi:hypothetical protein